MQLTPVDAKPGTGSAALPDAVGKADDVQARRRDLCRSLIRERHLIDRLMSKRFHANADFAMLLAVYLAEAEERETYQCEIAQATTIVYSY
jgi:hypothetical protein